MMTSHGILDFQSPINFEGSWGMRRVAVLASSRMELFLDPDETGVGEIEWEVRRLDLFESIGLWFSVDSTGKRTLVDYDGVMTLPDQAMDLLESHGVDCAEMRKTLAD